MDVARESLLVGDALEQVVELAAFLLGESGEQVALMVAGDVAEGGEHFASGGGEVEGVAAAVVLIAPALDQTAAVQRVQKGDETAGNHLQAGGQGLLRNAGAGAEDAQDAGVRGRQSHSEQALGEAAGGMTADLGEKEGGVAAGFGRFIWPLGLFHRTIVPY